MGICGGYQILGQYVEDPQGLEDHPGTTTGLDFLKVATVLKAPKTTTLSRFSWGDAVGEGYEIHMGQTTRLTGDPLFEVTSRNRRPCSDSEGAVSKRGNVAGSYMHGMFDHNDIKLKWLKSIGLDVKVSDCGDGLLRKNKSYELLKAHFETHVAMEDLYSNLRG